MFQPRPCHEQPQDLVGVGPTVDVAPRKEQQGLLAPRVQLQELADVVPQARSLLVTLALQDPPLLGQVVVDDALVGPLEVFSVRIIEELQPSQGRQPAGWCIASRFLKNARIRRRPRGRHDLPSVRLPVLRVPMRTPHGQPGAATMQAGGSGAAGCRRLHKSHLCRHVTSTLTETGTDQGLLWVARRTMYTRPPTPFSYVLRTHGAAHSMRSRRLRQCPYCCCCRLLSIINGYPVKQ